MRLTSVETRLGPRWTYLMQEEKLRTGVTSKQGKEIKANGVASPLKEWGGAMIYDSRHWA